MSPFALTLRRSSTLTSTHSVINDMGKLTEGLLPVRVPVSYQQLYAGPVAVWRHQRSYSEKMRGTIFSAPAVYNSSGLSASEAPPFTSHRNARRLASLRKSTAAPALGIDLRSPAKRAQILAAAASIFKFNGGPKSKGFEKVDSGMEAEESSVLTTAQATSAAREAILESAARANENDLAMASLMARLSTLAYLPDPSPELHSLGLRLLTRQETPYTSFFIATAATPAPPSSTLPSPRKMSPLPRSGHGTTSSSHLPSAAPLASSDLPSSISSIKPLDLSNQDQGPENGKMGDGAVHNTADRGVDSESNRPAVHPPSTPPHPFRDGSRRPAFYIIARGVAWGRQEVDTVRMWRKLSRFWPVLLGHGTDRTGGKGSGGSQSTRASAWGRSRASRVAARTGVRSTSVDELSRSKGVEVKGPQGPRGGASMNDTGIMVHAGVNEIADDLLEHLLPFLSLATLPSCSPESLPSFHFGGHSLGGSISLLLMLKARLHIMEEAKKRNIPPVDIDLTVHTYGSPPVVGNKAAMTHDSRGSRPFGTTHSQRGVGLGFGFGLRGARSSPGRQKERGTTRISIAEFVNKQVEQSSIIKDISAFILNDESDVSSPQQRLRDTSVSSAKSKRSVTSSTTDASSELSDKKQRVEVIQENVSVTSKVACASSANSQSSTTSSEAFESRHDWSLSMKSMLLSTSLPPFPSAPPSGKAAQQPSRPTLPSSSPSVSPSEASSLDPPISPSPLSSPSPSSGSSAQFPSSRSSPPVFYAPSLPSSMTAEGHSEKSSTQLQPVVQPLSVPQPESQSRRSSCLFRSLGLPSSSVCSFVLDQDLVPRAFLRSDPLYHLALQGDWVQAAMQWREQMWPGGEEGAVLTRKRFLYESVGDVFFMRTTGFQVDVWKLRPDEAEQVLLMDVGEFVAAPLKLVQTVTDHSHQRYNRDLARALNQSRKQTS
eukprot:TRINITY_DN4263_c0_g1_i1.p1 TRINITY_DN4263_c0_g1~~TRINITY_DN4263_c0_g1_i1.p1  ORF type:complete len:942 (-),score=127.51 TRINITY_DN4263_c0_g1_i1:618-3443(-)